MKKAKKILTSPVTTIAAFVLAAGLLLFSSVGGARAALTYFSDDYSSDIRLEEIGVTLLENGAGVRGELLTGLIPEGESLKFGKAYPEVLSVQNSGAINEYVRVSIYKYWTDEDGEKLTTLSPDLIGLILANVGSGWILDGEASTSERTVLYYSGLLGTGESTPAFTDTLTIDGDIAGRVRQTSVSSGGYTTITTIYEYDGARFCVEAKVDAVQEHNAQDAIWSAWGRRVTVNNGVLSLN